MGWPKYADRSGVGPVQEEVVASSGKPDEAEEVVEGQSAFRRLQWLSRIQYSRVRKALKTEGMMGGLNLSTTADDIKLLSDLIDKELAIAIKTGEVKAAPQQTTLEIPGVGTLDQAQAMRVWLAYRRIKGLLAPETEESDGPATDGGGDAVGTPLPGAAGSGPVGPAPGADGAHGRT